MSKYLLVEGNDDLHVVSALLQKFEIPETFHIIDCKGIDSLLKSLPVRLKTSGVKKIAIIVDADQDIAERWRKLKEVLNPLVNNLPEMPSPEGTYLLTSTNQEIMVWLMPNNEINGMLEDFISFLIPKNDLLMPFVENSLNEIESKKLNKYAQIHHTKALVHTWLAWQENPGTPLGLSITKRYLNTDSETCLQFVDWISKI